MKATDWKKTVFVRNLRFHIWRLKGMAFALGSLQETDEGLSSLGVAGCGQGWCSVPGLWEPRSCYHPSANSNIPRQMVVGKGHSGHWAWKELYITKEGHSSCPCSSHMLGPPIHWTQLTRSPGKEPIDIVPAGQPPRARGQGGRDGELIWRG